MSNKRTFHKSAKLGEERENPIWRTFRVLKDDILLKNQIYANGRKTGITKGFPNQADIVVIGGGAIGSSIAYWLKEKTNYEAVRVVVIEKDTTVKKMSTMY